MKSDNNQNYISLQEATKLCNYSQEYLSLRARHGKLKALKFCRNWVTTKEWLGEYLVRAEEYNRSIDSKKAEKKIVKIELVKHLPPKNLPVETFSMAKGLRLQDLRPVFSFALVFVLLIAGGIFGKESLISTYNDFSPYVQEINRVGDLFTKDAVQSLTEVYQDIQKFSDNFYLAAVNYQDTAKFAVDVFGEYSRWLKNQIIK